LGGGAGVPAVGSSRASKRRNMGSAVDPASGFVNREGRLRAVASITTTEPPPRIRPVIGKSTDLERAQGITRPFRVQGRPPRADPQRRTPKRGPPLARSFARVRSVRPSVHPVTAHPVRAPPVAQFKRGAAAGSKPAGVDNRRLRADDRRADHDRHRRSAFPGRRASETSAYRAIRLPRAPAHPVHAAWARPRRRTAGYFPWHPGATDARPGRRTAGVRRRPCAD
jgi:hypothetical protein